MPIYHGHDSLRYYMWGMCQACKCLDNSHPYPPPDEYVKQTLPSWGPDNFAYLERWKVRKAQLLWLDKQQTPGQRQDWLENLWARLGVRLEMQREAEIRKEAEQRLTA